MFYLLIFPDINLRESLIRLGVGRSNALSQAEDYESGLRGNPSFCSYKFR